MLTLVIRKILNNAWKVLCLLLGSILVVALICSVPIYTSGILQRMLTKDLESSQVEFSRYPGYLVLSSQYSYVGSDLIMPAMDDLRTGFDKLVENMPVDPLVTAEFLQIKNLYHEKEINGDIKKHTFSFSSITDFESHISMVKGRMYQNVAEDGVIEAVVTDAALKDLNLLLDHEYEIRSYRQSSDEAPLLTIRIVGMFTALDNQDLYWYKNLNLFSQSILIDPSVLDQLTIDHDKLKYDEQILVSAFDYHQFHIRDIRTLQNVIDDATALVEGNYRTTRMISTFALTIKNYATREAELQLTLQILIVPILLMLIFYIFMVSQLLVQSENSIISVLESRGASRSQILAIYGIESLIYGFIAIVAGPVLGLWMVRIIGASNGFLEFVNRKALPAEIDAQAMLYALAAVLVFMVTILVPVFMQSRTSIVESKRKRSRRTKSPFWQRIFLDIVLLGISLYALYRLNEQLAIQKETGLAGIDINLDFLLFLSSTLFILGAGLFFLRLYPWMIRLITFAGRRFWSPVLYASFHEISHTSGQRYFLMLFLILALSIGLFNANAARTINRNTEDKIHCAVGADIVLQEYWRKYDRDGNPISDIVGFGMGMTLDSSSVDTVVKYYEPSFAKYRQLEGVESAARVFRADQSRIRKGSLYSGLVNLMAVDPYDFAMTAWTRSDLNNYHMNAYMNVMMSMPNAVILSRNLKDELELSVGDGIVYTVNNTDRIDGVIIAFVDYWPGYQPIEIKGGKAYNASLIVSSLEYMLSKTAIQPYEVWIRRTSEATDKMIYDGIETANINVTSLSSATQQITSAKNDPQLQGSNGALTLGFIVSMLICAAGFLIYWVLSVQGRVLQFGIFRAMGLSKSAVIGMLVWEQILVSGIAILVGVLIGNLSGYLFIPLFQLVYSSADQPIPFSVISVQSDTSKIFLVLGILLLVCFVVLTRLILKIKIDQAVKLGEE